jgi:hypothetical protein
MRGGGAIGGAIFRMVPALSLEGGGGLRSGELPPLRMLFSGARAGILDGLLMTDADIEAPKVEAPKLVATELARGLRDTLAPKFDDTGVLDRLGGGPCIVPARLRGADFADALDSCLVGMPLFEGVFARGGAAFWAEAYSSSRYRWP